MLLHHVFKGTDTYFFLNAKNIHLEKNYFRKSALKLSFFCVSLTRPYKTMVEFCKIDIKFKQEGNDDIFFYNFPKQYQVLVLLIDILQV